MIFFLAQIGFLALVLTGGFVAVAIAAARRRARQASLLWLLAITVEKGLPLEDELEALSDGLTGRHRTDVLYLADLLDSGDALPEALAEVPGIVPQHALLAAQTGAESGRLAQALRDAAVRHEARWRPESAPAVALVGSVLYSGAIIVYALFVVSFLMYWIVPKFKKIFEDFDTELPGPTIELIAASDLMFEYFPAVLLGMLAGAALLGFIAWATIRGWGEFRFNGIGGLLTRVDLPDVLRNLSLVTAAGLPVERGLATIAREHQRTNIRRRSAVALAECRAGRNPWQALAHAGLIRAAEADLLQSAQTSGNVPWALRELADAIDQRRWFRWAAAIEVLQPVAVALLGIIVLLICVGFFMPLVTLVNDLS
jgi:type II secretory pathway component PulF